MFTWLKQIVTLLFVCFVTCVTLFLMFGMMSFVTLTFENLMR